MAIPATPATSATPEQILERVWRAINAMPDEVAKLPPSNNDAYQYFVRRAQSPLCEAFSLAESSYFPRELLERAAELGLTPEQVLAAIECWRRTMSKAVDELAERYMVAAKKLRR